MIRRTRRGSGEPGGDAPVSRYMDSAVPYLRQDMWTDAAAVWLRRLGAEEAPVVDAEGRLRGLVWREALEVDEGPGRARVRDAMVPYAPTIDEDSPVSEAVSRLLVRHLRRLYVAHADGTLAGEFSLRDLARGRPVVPPAVTSGPRLRDLMLPVVPVPRQVALRRALPLFRAHHATLLAVLDRGDAVGVLLAGDAHALSDGPDELTVGDLMRSPAPVLGPDDTLASVAPILAHEPRCVLVEERGHLCGVVHADGARVRLASRA